MSNLIKQKRLQIYFVSLCSELKLELSKKMKYKLFTRRFFLFFVSLFAVGCAAFNYQEKDAPVAATTLTTSPNSPRIAIVLGSGGPRGYAHIGAIKVLEQAGLEPNLIVGSSVGALIGAFWADGRSASQIQELAFAGGPLTLFDLNPFADRGWIRGQKLQDYVGNLLGNRSIEQLAKPMIIVATDRTSKVPVFFYRGNIAVAIRASSAVPGIISPVGITNVEYEDADVSLPVAVKIARAAGAQFVIAIDVSARPGSAPAGTEAKWLERDAQRLARIQPEVAHADFVIHPDMGYLASPSRSFFEKAFKSGETETQARLPELLAALRAKGLIK
jgi:NTE family protein